MIESAVVVAHDAFFGLRAATSDQNQPARKQCTATLSNLSKMNDRAPLFKRDPASSRTMATRVATLWDDGDGATHSGVHVQQQRPSPGSLCNDSTSNARHSSFSRLGVWCLEGALQSRRRGPGAARVRPSTFHGLVIGQGQRSAGGSVACAFERGWPDGSRRSVSTTGTTNCLCSLIAG